LEDVSDNPQCLDSFALNMVRFGGTKGLLIIAGACLALAAYIWVFITLHA